jgi:hypothetical protein
LIVAWNLGTHQFSTGNIVHLNLTGMQEVLERFRASCAATFAAFFVVLARSSGYQVVALKLCKWL